MQGASIRINLNDLPVLIGALAETRRRAQDMTPLMEAVGQAGVESTIDRFEYEIGPDGLPWKQSHRARVEGGKTLSKSGRLRESVHFQASAKAAEWGTNAIYAGVHQFGAVIRSSRAVDRKGRSPGKLRFFLPGVGVIDRPYVTIPARPFLGFNDDDRAEIEDLAIGYISGAWE